MFHNLILFYYTAKRFFLDNTIYYKYQSNFSRHTKKNFKSIKVNQNKKKIVLLEYYPNWASHISFNYLITLLCQKYNSTPIVYLPIQASFLKKILYFLLLKLNLSHFKILNSYNINNMIVPSSNNFENYKFKKLYSKIKKLKDKSQVVRLKLYGITVGDLIYDGFLKKYNEYTLDPKNEKFEKYYSSFLKTFLFWYNYIKKNNVVSVVASHPVYENAVPLRIAYELNKDAFTSSLHFTYRHSKKEFTFNYDVKNRFKKLNKKEKQNGLILANKILKKIFAGKRIMQSEVFTLPGSEQRKPIFQRIKASNKKKQNNNILIAIHSFSDAPHVFGKLIFADHYEWLNFLGKETNKLRNFNWLLKIHPIYYDKEINMVKKIMKDFPHIKILPKSTTHKELINKGIKFVFSVYGSVVYEYAYFGIPSILASHNHPYKNFRFVKDAKNLKEYKKIIKNLNILNINFSKKDVLEYCYMRFAKSNKMFNDYTKVADEIGEKIRSPLIYDKWIKELSESKNKKIIKKYKSFINSKKYRFEYYD
tara:strand:+ start:3339 stop:4940 length:1602 start_codon:yes stop_codon:yes gene_type:complete